CTLSGNSASFGGGLFNTGTLVLTGSTLSGNSASFGGGGGIDNAGTLSLTNCTLAGNSAATLFGGGGGTYNPDTGTLSLTNCTLTGNSARFGGGLFNTGTTVTVVNTIIAGNTASAQPDVDGAVTSRGHNLIGNGNGATLTPQNGDQIGFVTTRGA